MKTGELEPAEADAAKAQRFGKSQQADRISEQLTEPASIRRAERIHDLRQDESRDRQQPEGFRLRERRKHRRRAGGSSP